ncbi:MAG: hypothetical protein AVDCRST_MAG68-1208, partial [uncultured Gemmatimonadetes bacterium]
GVTQERLRSGHARPPGAGADQHPLPASTPGRARESAGRHCRRPRSTRGGRPGAGAGRTRGALCRAHRHRALAALPVRLHHPRRRAHRRRAAALQLVRHARPEGAAGAARRAGRAGVPRGRRARHAGPALAGVPAQRERAGAARGRQAAAAHLHRGGAQRRA